MKNNSNVLQVAEVENYDADLTADSSKTNKEDERMNFLQIEGQKTLGYQDTLKIDVESIDKSKNTIWRSICEVIDIHFLKKP